MTSNNDREPRAEDVQATIGEPFIGTRAPLPHDLSGGMIHPSFTSGEALDLERELRRLASIERVRGSLEQTRWYVRMADRVAVAISRGGGRR